MRIALCISGHFRTYKKVYPEFLKNVLLPLQNLGQVDVFISTWQTLNPVRSWHFKKDQPEELLNLAEIKELYNPKLATAYDFRKIKETFLLNKFTKRKLFDDRICHEGMLFSTPMFFQIALANALKSSEEKTNGKYDLVFRYRPDQTFTTPIQIPQPTLENHLNVLSCDFAENETRIDDTFFWGTSEVMDKACSLYYNLTDILNTFPSKLFGPEVIFAWHLHRQGLKTIKVPQSNKLVR